MIQNLMRVVSEKGPNGIGDVIERIKGVREDNVSPMKLVIERT